MSGTLLSLREKSKEEILNLLQLAGELKSAKKAGKEEQYLRGKNMVLLFEKASTRTRCAFEVAAFDQGAHVTYLTNSQVGKKESIADTAQVLGRFYDGIGFRGALHQTVTDLATYAGIPVWNGLTDDFHPTQILADFLTAQEHIHKPLDQMKLVFLGDARSNMGNSLMIGAAKVGMDFTAVAPKSLYPKQELIDDALSYGAGSTLTFTESLDGVEGADILYTDVWFSMGEEDQMESRIKLLEPYRLTMDLVKKTGNPEVKVMHCLPAFHDRCTVVGEDVYQKFGLTEMEITDEVFQSKHSVVFDEAENRMHTIKAVMVSAFM